jgi:hypothetical protein
MARATVSFGDFASKRFIQSAQTQKLKCAGHQGLSIGCQVVSTRPEITIKNAMKEVHCGSKVSGRLEFHPPAPVKFFSTTHREHHLQRASFLVSQMFIIKHSVALVLPAGSDGPEPDINLHNLTVVATRACSPQSHLRTNCC